ncbi:MAG: calcium-binding protein [Pseudomonadota bacterium]
METSVRDLVSSGGIFFNGYSVDEQEEMIVAMEQLYGIPKEPVGYEGGSFFFRSLLFEVELDGKILTFENVPNTAQALVDGFLIQLDPALEETYIDASGNYQNTGLAGLIAHEMGHATGGYRDTLDVLDGSEANPDYLGGNDDYVNRIRADMGWEAVVSYHGLLAENREGTPVFDRPQGWTGNQAVDVVLISSSLTEISSGVQFPGLNPQTHLNTERTADLIIDVIASNDSSIASGLGNDFLYGLRGNDIFLAGAGDDYIDGGVDYDTVLYTDKIGDESGAGTQGINVDWNGRNVTVTDQYGDTDTLVDIEIIEGTKLDDTVRLQGSFSDVVNSGFANGLFDLTGGPSSSNDFDTLILDFDRGVTVDFEAGTVTDGTDSFTFFEFEGVSGTSFTDTIKGDGQSNKIDGKGGKDKIEGGGGNDVIRGGDEVDVLRGDDGNDIIEGQSGADRIYGGSGEDLLFAFDFDDAGSDADDGKMWGGAGDDILVGGSGDDQLIGQGGDDIIFGGGGSNVLAGGGGRDYIVSTGIDDIIIGGGGRDWINALSSGENTTVIIDGASGWDYISQGEDGYTGVSQIFIDNIARDDMKLVWDYEVLESVGSIDFDQQNKAFGSFEFTSETLYSETRGGFAYLVTEDERTAINIGYVEGTFEQIVGEGRNFVVDPETGANLGLEWRNEYRTTASLVNDHEIYLDGGNTVLAPFISESLNVKTEGTTILADSGVLSGQAIDQDNIRKYEKTPDKVRQNFDNEFAQFNGGGLIAIEAPQDIADILTQDALDILGADVFAFV